MNTLELFGTGPGAPVSLGAGISLLRGFADSSRLMPLVERVARAALTEVRAAVSGMRNTAFAAELVAATALLEAQGIRVDAQVQDIKLPHDRETALALSLREAATNVSRHAAATGGLLEYPVYTKPPSWRGLDVPEVLFSGHHAQIARWRRDQALRRTAERRPDLLERLDDESLDERDREVLADFSDD